MTSQPCEITMGGLGHVLACLRSVSTLGTRSVSTPNTFIKVVCFCLRLQGNRHIKLAKTKYRPISIFQRWEIPGIHCCDLDLERRK